MSTTPDQRSVYDQLVSLYRITGNADVTNPLAEIEAHTARALVTTANKNGLYDAADYLTLKHLRKQ